MTTFHVHSEYPLPLLHPPPSDSARATAPLFDSFLPSPRYSSPFSWRGSGTQIGFLDFDFVPENLLLAHGHLDKSPSVQLKVELSKQEAEIQLSDGYSPSFEPTPLYSVGTHSPSLLSSVESPGRCQQRKAAHQDLPCEPFTFGSTNMVRKRRSLQSIFVPPFFQSSSSSDASPTPSSRFRSHSASASTSYFQVNPPPLTPSAPPVPQGIPSAIPISPSHISLHSEFTSAPRNSPPSDLLDDDPFADLSSGPSVISFSDSQSRGNSSSHLPRLTTAVDSGSDPVLLPTPRSPLSQSSSTVASLERSLSFSASYDHLPCTPPPTPLVKPKKLRHIRPCSSGQSPVRPAYTRPAFRARPSLPSLHALAQAQVVVPRVRRGRVGAQLPFEPWESQGSDISSSETETLEQTDLLRPSHNRRPSNLTTIRDSRLITETPVQNDTAFDFSPAPHHSNHAYHQDHNEDVSSLILSSSRSDGALGLREVDVSPSSAPPIIRANSEPTPSSIRPPFPSPSTVEASSSFPDATDESSSSSPSTSTSSRSSSPVLTECGSSISVTPVSSPERELPNPPFEFADCDDLEHSYPRPAFSTMTRTSVFSRSHVARSIYADISDTLEYDYTDALRQLGPSPTPTPRLSMEAIVGYSREEHQHLQEGVASSNEFEPGTSADTIRSLSMTSSGTVYRTHRRNVSSSSASFSSSSTTGQTIEWTTTTDSGLIPLSSPISTISTTSSSEPSSSIEGGSRQRRGRRGRRGSSSNSYSYYTEMSSVSSRTSASSGIESGADFLSFYSSSSEESLSLGGSSQYQSAVEVFGLAEPSTPYNSMIENEDGTFEFEEEKEDGVEMSQRISGTGAICDGDGDVVEAVDGDEGGGRRSGYGRSNGDNHGDSGRCNGGGSSYGAGSGSGGGYAGGSGSGSGGHGGGRDGDDDRNNRRPTGRSPMPRSAQRDSDTSEDESADDYGEESPNPPPTPSTKPFRTPPPPPPDSVSNTDDDVPLAQQIPSALKAQKTIRRQVRDEIDSRRKSRKSDAVQSSPIIPSRSLYQATARTSHLAAVSGTGMSSSQEASSHAAAASTSMPRHVGRPRTKTLPSQPTSPFAINDLTSKLLGVQAISLSGRSSSRRPSEEHQPPPRSPQLPAKELSSLQVSSQSPMRSTHGEQDRRLRTFDSPERSLRPSRSFHRPRTAGDMDAPPPLPFHSSNVKLGRSATTIRTKPQQDAPPIFMPPFTPYNTTGATPEGHTSLDRSRSARSASRRPSLEQRDRLLMRPGDNDNNTPPRSSHRPPMPPLPSSEVVTTFSSPPLPPPPMPKPIQTWQQRIFVGNLQRFCQVEMSASTSSADVLRTLESQGALYDGPGGGWMLFEVCHDFGMERPIRSFEVLADVSSSWNRDKTVNVFMARRTTFQPILSRAAIPSSSPIFSGYIQYEYKRGKWQKRWMELREHSLWLSKKDTGKDQTFVCSLSHFDAYASTRAYKSPKPFIFAIKSTDKLSFFEDTADYMHMFCCNEKEGHNWLQNILLARSYVLYQEKNVLLSSSAGGGASLSRAGTRKGQRSAQPLLNFGSSNPNSATVDVPPVPNVFEPGSLLAKRL